MLVSIHFSRATKPENGCRFRTCELAEAAATLNFEEVFDVDATDQCDMK